MICPSSCEEHITSSRPEDVVQELAEQKAQNVYTDRLASHPGEPFLVIGSDTVVSNNGKILGKPSGEEEARHMIQSLQDHTHQVYTGVSLSSMTVQTQRQIPSLKKAMWTSIQ
mgnify:CR=1 FL=1